MSDSSTFTDEYEHFNYDYDKYIFSKNGGKQRSKREVSEHTNHFDPNGHSRKIVTKLHNTEMNKRNVTKAKA
ncbi:nuclear protein 1 [Microplitis demolitor]|uniref:nuclear protein 1 n=1 Tax=Microplitis demolitor TaxID=69319 RepID=UPI0006D50C4B|nr:nuclear protein 1 [Microplitis demolitor]